LVTGAAGFIGSTLSERLVLDGWDVVGVDNFCPYYDPAIKRRNAQSLLALGGRIHEADLADCDLDPLFDGVDVVFHQAGQPGVRLSWSTGFDTYVKSNIAVTQRLLEFSKSRELQRFVLASSSSVYGDTAPCPSKESDHTVPFSPYGVTKLAAELLVRAYAANFSVPAVALRYFTVYGPRQRPDMAISLLFDRAAHSQPFTLFGDGSQIRDFTFVDDVVDANVRAASADLKPGEVLNVAGGSSVSMLDLLRLVEATTERKLEISWDSERPGDVRRTGGDVSRTALMLGWAPSVGLAEGLQRQWEWRLRSQDA
jgi:nucleoside-diphosphate-sugar epimerase